jgi:hypothetical protein
MLKQTTRTQHTLTTLFEFTSFTGGVVRPFQRPLDIARSMNALGFRIRELSPERDDHSRWCATHWKQNFHAIVDRFPFWHGQLDPTTGYVLEKEQISGRFLFIYSTGHAPTPISGMLWRIRVGRRGGGCTKKINFTLFGYSRESEAPVGVELPESDVAWHQNCRRGAGLRTTTEFLGRCDKQGQLFIVQATFLTVLLLVCRNIFTTLVENLMGLRIENAFVWPMTHHKSLIKLCIYTE